MPVTSVNDRWCCDFPDNHPTEGRRSYSYTSTCSTAPSRPPRRCQASLDGDLGCSPEPRLSVTTTDLGLSLSICDFVSDRGAANGSATNARAAAWRSHRRGCLRRGEPQRSPRAGPCLSACGGRLVPPATVADWRWLTGHDGLNATLAIICFRPRAVQVFSSVSDGRLNRKRPLPREARARSQREEVRRLRRGHARLYGAAGTSPVAMRSGSSRPPAQTRKQLLGEGAVGSRPVTVLVVLAPGDQNHTGFERFQQSR